MSRMLSLLLPVSLVIAFVACAPKRYAYAPATTTSAEVVGHPAAEYAFPPDAPHGQVRLATFGLAQLTDQSPRSIHLRMVLTNRGTEPWVVDKSEQKLEVSVRGRTVALPATTMPTSPSRVEVAPGGTVALDLFFPLPAGVDDASEVPAFLATWTVHAGPRDVTMHTPFERFLASTPVRTTPMPAHPLDRSNRLPGTPDSRWPQRGPLPIVPDPMPVPGPP